MREEHAAAKASRPTSKLKAPTIVARGQKSPGSDPDITTLLEEPTEIASAKRDSAYRGLGGVKKEYESVQSKMQALGISRLCSHCYLSNA